MTLWPTRRLLMLRGGVEVDEWSQQPGEGRFPRSRRCTRRQTLPGPWQPSVTYLHTQGTVGFDWRPSPGYSRRGGFYGVTLHDYKDKDEAFGFRQVDYEAIQHFPILRETWVISLRGAGADRRGRKAGQQMPFFMLPSLGGGTTLRGYEQLALPRSEQPAASGASGASWSAASWIRRCSTTPARSRRDTRISISTG